VCSASRANVLSGLSVQHTGVYYLDQTFLGVNPGKKQIDDMFADAGYLKQRYGKVDHVYSTHVDQPLPATMPYANKVCPAPVGEGAFDWGPAPNGDAAQPDYQYAQSGIDFLSAAHDKPFFLSVGFARPHTGWYVPQRYFDMYPKDTLVLPSGPSDDLEDLGTAGKAAALKFNFHKCITDQNLWADAVQAYLASISWVDSQLARLLAALDASAYANNTIVVVWSDHGFHLGEKFHWQKLALWERATRVPLLIRVPGQSERVTVDTCVSLRDLAPTLLDRCGVAPAYAMDGISLNPLIADPNLPWDYPVLTTKDQHDHAIRTPSWRYIRYANGERELYDERADPGELHNLASDSQYESVMAQLDALMPPKP
jgi:arylsulfatase A-like enzyme